MLFNQLQKILIFHLFWSTCYKIYSLQNTSVNTIAKASYKIYSLQNTSVNTNPKANSNSINTKGRYPHEMTLQY